MSFSSIGFNLTGPEKFASEPCSDYIANKKGNLKLGIFICLRTSSRYSIPQPLNFYTIKNSNFTAKNLKKLQLKK